MLLHAARKSPRTFPPGCALCPARPSDGPDSCYGQLVGTAFLPSDTERPGQSASRPADGRTFPADQDRIPHRTGHLPGSLACVRQGLRKGFVLVLLPAALSGCGGGTTTASSSLPQLSSVQYENAQRLFSYARALSVIMAPFQNAPAHLTTRRELHTGASRLSALVPPPAFRASHDHILHGMLSQLALLSKLEDAGHAHDAVALRNVELKLQPPAQEVQSGLAETNEVLARCESSHYSC
jgi:hypothetical protein